MSDFTKEELKELIYGLWCGAKITGKIVNKNLYDKLKLMIDNYCEHYKAPEPQSDWDDSLHNPSRGWD